MLLVNAMSRQPLQVHGRSMASAFRQNQGDVMFLVALLLLVVRPGAPSSFLFLVAMPCAPSSFLLLVRMLLIEMPGAPSSVLAPSSKAIKAQKLEKGMIPSLRQTMSGEKVQRHV